MKLAIAVSPTRRKFAAVPLQGDIAASLGLAAEIGYDAVELNVGHPREVDVAILKEAMKRTGLPAICIATGAAYFEDGLCLTADAKADRDKAIERIRIQCDFGASIGAKVLIGMMRGRLDADPDKAARQRDWFAQSLEACAKAARDAGTSLLIEPMNRYETNFLPTVRETQEFLTAHGRDDILLMLDTFHMNIEEVDMAAAVAAGRTRIDFIQMVDSNRRAPGMGHIDFGSIIAALAASNFDGYLSVEVVAWPDGPAAARAGHAHLRGLLARLGA
jgi:sugar phosphate isomerase/epimerase